MAIGRTDKDFLVRVRADIKDAVGKMKDLEQSMSKQERTAGKVGAAFKAVGPAIAGLITAQTVQAVVNTTLAFDKLENKLKFATGSTKAAADEMKFLRDTAERLGLDLLSTGDAYASLAAAAKGTALEGTAAREIFTAVSEASRVMGLSADETTGALKALEQMISKGTVQAEELRGQLGERLPGAFQIASRAMGVTTEELGDMLQSGEVLAEDLLPKLAKELRAAVAKDVEDAAGGAAAGFARMSTAVDELVNAIGDSGLVSLLAAVAEAAAKVVRAFAGLDQIRFFEDSTTDTLNKAKERLADVNEEIAKMERIASGQGGFFESTFEYTAEQAEENLVRLRREAIEIQRNMARQLFAEPEAPASAPTAPTTGGRPPRKPSGTTGGRSGTKRDPSEDAVARLEFEAATYGKTTAEIALYRLQLQGASKDQIARAEAALNAIAAEEGFARAQEEAAKLAEETAEATARENEVLDRQAQYWTDLVNPILDYQRQLEELQGLFDNGKISADTYLTAVDQVKEGIVGLAEDAEKTGDEMGQFMIQAARNIQDELGSGLKDIMGGNFDDIEDRFVDMLDTMVAEALAAQLGKALFGDYDQTGAVGGIFGSVLGSLFHGGGIVGQAGPRAGLPALMAANAPRYHTGGLAGLKPDERPAILQLGEEVLTRADPRHRMNGGGKVINNTFVLPDVQDVETFRRHQPSLAREMSRAAKVAEDQI